jgi:hypothetical protein
VIGLRARLSATAIVMAMLVAGASPVIAHAPAHAACLAHQHDCSNTARLKGCCGIEQGDRSDDSTPAAGKTQVAQPVAGGTGLVATPLAPTESLRHARASTTAPRSSLPDLITLFGTFLI